VKTEPSLQDKPEVRTKEGVDALLNAAGGGIQELRFLTPRSLRWHLQAVVDFFWNREGPLIQNCTQYSYS
jgi:hypothetical protein